MSNPWPRRLKFCALFGVLPGAAIGAGLCLRMVDEASLSVRTCLEKMRGLGFGLHFRCVRDQHLPEHHGSWRAEFDPEGVAVTPVADATMRCDIGTLAT
jgi:hypothetical protein